MEIKIHEKNPSGRESIKALLDTMIRAQGAADDVSSAFRSVAPLVKEKLRYTFSEANPAGWAGLKPKYRAWKVKHGYPVTIGILSGTLKSAATDQAEIEIGPVKMIYAVNDSLTNPVTSKLTGDYAGYFDEKRPIFGHVKPYVQGIVRQAVKKAVAAGWKYNG